MTALSLSPNIRSLRQNICLTRQFWGRLRLRNVPENFSPAQLQALRLLVRLALIHVGDQGKTNKQHYAALLTDSPVQLVTKDDLGHFARGPNMLGYSSRGLHSKKFQYLYDMIYNYFTKHDNRKLLFDCKILFDLIYGKPSAASGDDFWNLVTEQAVARSAAEAEEVGPQLVGCYRTYRRGTRLRSDGGEIVMSPMVVWEPSGIGGSYKFEISYPSREEGVRPADLGIAGHLIFANPFVYFVGYDRGSGSPYLLAIKSPRSNVATHHGIALRSTTDNVAVATRVYLKSSKEDWNELRLKPKISLVSTFRNDPSITDSADIIRYTQNAIDNHTAFTLRRYEHEPDD